MNQITLNQAYAFAEQNIRALIPLGNLSAKEVMRLCQCTSENLKVVINCIGQTWNDHQLLLNSKNTEWLAKTEDYNFASEQIRISNKTLGELLVKLAGLAENKTLLQEDLNRLESELPGLEAALSQRRKDKEIALGVGLGVGIGLAIFTFGATAIAGAGAIAGTVAAVVELEKDIDEKIKRVQSKKDAIAHLNDETSQVFHKVKIEEKNKQNIDDCMRRLERSRASLDQDIKGIGRRVTEIKNIQLILNQTISKYEFLKQNVEEIPDILEIIDENDIKSLLDVVTNNRISH